MTPISSPSWTICGRKWPRSGRRNTAKDRRIEYLQVQAAHHRLSVRGSLKVVGDRGKWCKECANPPASCDCASVPAVTANGNGAAKGDLFGHARISLPGQA